MLLNKRLVESCHYIFLAAIVCYMLAYRQQVLAG